jgi:hypothetical protein
MTIAGHIAKKVESMPAEQQHEVMALIERLELARGKGPLVSPVGLVTRAYVDLSAEEFQQLRREMWGGSTSSSRLKRSVKRARR